ncbi:hypothetical protein O6H91_15G062800 [Diphasiastrum complanatum]|uniref:Uncharacterized protein n=1 Tax=Diphasiastrum complanatum TaxID=34168 RepID=A0ACC2BIZ9_DIPCM|nr:hypothetical protein O6H91_15G062800 [Diphasiastrum complanatum]
MSENSSETRSKRHMGTIVIEGSSILLDINHGDRFTFARAHTSSMVKLGNVKCSLAPLIGCPFGSIFEVSKDPKGPHLVQVSQDKEIQSSNCNKTEVHGVEELDICSDRDNRDLIDDNTAQSLSELEISYMRRDGASGTKIVEALIANSASFQNKTTLSQEKYKRKKQKKHAPRIVVRCPSARSICEAYFTKEPSKIGYLRMDVLALLLSLANVGANADVLLLDELGGFLTAAVGERLGGFGTICSTYCASKVPSLGMLGLFNFTPCTSSSIFCAPLFELIQARSSISTAEGNHEVSAKGHSSTEADLHSTVLPESPLTALLPEQQTKIAGSLLDESEKILLVKGAQLETRMSKSLKASLIDSSIGFPVRVEMAAQEFSCSYQLNGEIEFPNQCTVDAKSQLQTFSLETDNLVGEGSIATVGQLDVDSQTHQLQGEIKNRTNCGFKGTDDMVHTATNAESKHDSQDKSLRAGRRASANQVAYWGRHGFSSLIVGAPEMDPLSVCKRMLPLLSPSAPFVIYHPYMQPLAECMHHLRKERMAVNLQLSEPWLREYQVLPSQTHPHMQMSSTAGFCLSEAEHTIHRSPISW